MNLFNALKDGLEGVLEGKIISFRTKRINKNGSEMVFTQARVGIPGLCLTFSVNIPEEFVPNLAENKEILLAPEIKVGDFEKPVLNLKVKGL